MAQPVRACPQPRNSEATRARILDAAAELFAESGFDDTTVRAIAARSGVTDGALYYHFESKRDILNALWAASPDEALVAAREQPQTREDLARAAEQSFDPWVSRARFLRVLFQQSVEGDARALEYRRAALDKHRATAVPSFRALYGDAASLVAEAQIYTQTGIVTDAMFRYGNALREVSREDAFRRRVRRLIDQALPRTPPACGEVPRPESAGVLAHYRGDAGLQAATHQGGSDARRGRQETRARILDAARALFGQQGFSATTVKDIARNCGITDAALYYHFRSKREMLDALLTSPWIGDFSGEPAQTPAVTGPMDISPDNVLDSMAANEATLRMILRQALAGDRTAIALHNQGTAAFEQRVFLRLRTTCDTEMARELADSVTMLFLGVYHHGTIEHGERFTQIIRTPDYRRFIKALVSLIFPAEDEDRPSPAPCAP